MEKRLEELREEAVWTCGHVSRRDWQSRLKEQGCRGPGAGAKTLPVPGTARRAARLVEESGTEWWELGSHR